MDKSAATKLSAPEVAHELKTSPIGLSDSEVNSRTLKFGPNLFKSDNTKRKSTILLNQFRSSLVYLLIVAAGLAFILKDFNDGIVITVILIINAGLGFFQEYRSELSVQKLQKLINKEVLTLRSGKHLLIPEKQLVPGDVIVLREGDVVGADVKLFEVNDLSVNESQLTGESVPVVKNIGSRSLVFAGSTVEKGEALGYVYATADRTELGKIAHLSATTKRVTQFEKSIQSFSTFLVRVTFITLTAVFILKLLLDHGASDIGSLLLFVIALSIAVVPEAMPVIVTVTLSRGALNLSKRHVIAKTLTAVEDLGNINVLCSDKTGTLTENRLTVKKLIATDEELFQRLAIASLESMDEKRQKFQSSFDKAFLSYVPDTIKKQVQHYHRLKELPFDPNSRRRRVVFTDGKTSYLVEIGSVETLMALTHTNHKADYAAIIKDDGKLGLRHLAIAYKEIHYTSAKNFDIEKHEDNLKFVGFVALEDPLRPSAKHTVKLAADLGVGLKILSGDSKEVTQYVATQVGLVNKNQTVVTGDDIDKLDDYQLSKVVVEHNAFARLNPEQKYRIIKLLKLNGNIVGYQGDGINDAPALKLADVAIAVSNATDVAQASADILLLHSDIGVIINGIKYGREIFANINKYIRFTFVSNWGNFFALSALYLMSVSALPILPIQVLLTSLLTDLPAITISTDNVDSEELMLPRKFNLHAVMFISLFLGSVTAIFEIMYYAIIKGYSQAISETGLYLFLTFSALSVIFVVRNKKHFWQAPKLSVPMKLSFTLISVLALGITYLPYTQKILSFTGLSLRLIDITVLSILVYLLVLDTVKVWFYKTNFSQND